MIREETIGAGEGVICVTLDRPERRNALQAEQWAALAAIVRDARGKVRERWC